MKSISRLTMLALFVFLAFGVSRVASATCEGDGPNGVVEGVEECDDNNTNQNDCCDKFCNIRAQNVGDSCEDGNDCTTATCSELGACTVSGNEENGIGCEDTDDCTTDTVCTDGQCGGGTIDENADCDDGNDCTGDGTCDAAGACVEGDPVNNPNATCDDGNPCTGDGTCDGTAICTPGEADLDQQGLDCDDGDVCTEGTTCNDVNCAGGTDLNCDDNEECTADSCDAVTGCANDDVANGTDCDSNNGTCQNGTCVPDGTNGPVCGNGNCESGENNSNCPEDCADVPNCGNDVCDAGENEDNCDQDCDDGDDGCSLNQVASSGSSMGAGLIFATLGILAAVRRKRS